MNAIASRDSIQVVQGKPMLEWFPINETVSIVALVLGILIIIIAYFAGGRENRNKILFSIIFSVTIGMLSMPLFIRFGIKLGILPSKWGEIFVLFILMVFVAAAACHAYEIVTVSAREARPD